MADGYAVTGLFINGNAQAEVTSIEYTKDGGKVEVRTLKGGFVGITPSGGAIEFSIDYVVPKDGFEFNFDNAVDDKGFYEVQYGVGPHKVVAPTQFLTNRITQSTDQSVSGTVTAKAKYRKMR